MEITVHSGAEVRACIGLVQFLISRDFEPAEFDAELARMGSFLVDRLVRTLTEAIDGDALDWTA
jgi:hypothetical protein